MKKDVLGIKIDDVNIDQALETVQGWLSKPGKHYIVTPNPELVVMAKEDQQLKKIINNADLAIPDGRGLKLAGDIVCNTPGIDLMEGLIKLAAEKAFTTGFLGGREGVAEKMKERLLKKYPKLKISFAESGGEVDNSGNVIARTESFTRLLRFAGNDKGVDLLFVAFGQPKQEKWIDKNFDKISVKVVMGVGGAFDYLSGSLPRAPGWLRSLGLEWLFRLIIQPWRIRRQLALIKYLFYILRTR